MNSPNKTFFFVSSCLGGDHYFGCGCAALGGSVALFLLAIKFCEEPFMFAHLEKSEEENLVGHCTIADAKPSVTHRFRFQNNVPLNESHQDLEANFLEYWEEPSTAGLF